MSVLNLVNGTAEYAAQSNAQNTKIPSWLGWVLLGIAVIAILYYYNRREHEQA